MLTGGRVTEGTKPGEPAAGERPSLTRQVTGGLDSNDGLGGQSYKFNGIMVLIACYWCCVLTDWGNPGGGASSASPTAGSTVKKTRRKSGTSLRSCAHALNATPRLAPGVLHFPVRCNLGSSAHTGLF